MLYTPLVRMNVRCAVAATISGAVATLLIAWSRAVAPVIPLICGCLRRFIIRDVGKLVGGSAVDWLLRRVVGFLC